MAYDIGKGLFFLCGVLAVCNGVGVTCPISDAHHPCVCTDLTIDCEGHSLIKMPTFVTSGHFSILKLGKNNFTRIDVAQFAALNVSQIDLSYNNINSLHSNAFAGIQDLVRNISLAHNNLIALPDALNQLSHIHTLDVSWNPIPGYKAGHDGLEDMVMRAIGDTLTSFTFGSPNMTSWPHSLTHLNQLQELTVSGIFLLYWPATAFHGFEQTLKVLTIESASIATVPIALNTLMSLKELHMNHLDIPQPNGSPSLFGDDSLISAPFATLSNTLQILSLDYDGLTTFPEGIRDLTSLKVLSLDGNNLVFVSDEAIKLLKDADVSKLSLRNCRLKRVPSAISDLTHLIELDLSENYIRSIESTDLENLNNLITLFFDLNPMKYISDNSLCGLTKLQNFYLKNTSLTELSPAFRNLKSLRMLDLTHSRIDCTCDITWVKAWKENCSQKNITEILGECETINMEIQQYVNFRLASCPGYAQELADIKVMSVHRRMRNSSASSKQLL